MPLTQEDQKKYKTLYLQTARERMNDLRNNLAQLQAGKETDQLIETLHRDAHSLKGQSLMMEFQSTGTLAMVIEKIFLAKMQKKLDISTELLTKLTEAISEIEASLDMVEKESHEKDLSQFTAALQKMVPTLQDEWTLS